MPRIPALHPETASGQSQRLLQGAQDKLGFAPNIMRTMAHSPAVLEGYLNFSTTLAKGMLSGKLREQIALAVSEVNACGYCLAAHAALGRTLGLSDEAIRDSRRGESPDPKTATALAFARKVVDGRGWVEDAEIDRLRKAGFTDGEIVELLATIALTLFTNYFNHVAGTEVDFPTDSVLAEA